MIYATTRTSRASVLVALAALQCACSSSTSGPLLLSGGDASTSPPEVPQAAVTSSLGPTTSAPTQCSTTKPFIWTIGPAPVKDGDSQNGAVVSVACKVTGDTAAGYDVAATATMAGQGTVAITGHFSGGTGSQSGITGKFIEASGLGSFSQSDCVVTFAGGSQGIASGRIWATIACTNATDTKSSAVCDGESEFRFENCAQ